MSIRPFREIKRAKTKVINVGDIKVGGDNPISVQSMTNTLTTDVKATRENLEKTRKVNVNFTIDKHLYEQFKRVAQKDMRKYSNIVEGSIRRYVQNKT